MSSEQPDNPLHGVTLKTVVEDLVERRGWDDLADRIRIRCFSQDPSVRSSLKFLRKTPWAREQVEQLYIADQEKIQRNRKRNQRRAAMRAHRAASEEQPKEEEPAGVAAIEGQPDEADSDEV